jgi:hypothetical protein
MGWLLKWSMAILLGSIEKLDGRCSGGNLYGQLIQVVMEIRS